MKKETLKETLIRIGGKHLTTENSTPKSLGLNTMNEFYDDELPYVDRGDWDAPESQESQSDYMRYLYNKGKLRDGDKLYNAMRRKYGTSTAEEMMDKINWGEGPNPYKRGKDFVQAAQQQYDTDGDESDIWTDAHYGSTGGIDPDAEEGEAEYYKKPMGFDDEAYKAYLKGRA